MANFLSDRMCRRSFLSLAGLAVAGPLLHAAEDPSLEGQIEAIRNKAGLPALGGGIMEPDGAGQLVVSGVRKAGTSVKATSGDRWHIGSNTKAMTATLLGILVDEGKLAWTATLEELLPRDCERCADGVKNITVAHLLTHRAGLPANLPDWWAVSDRERNRILRLAAPEKGPAIAPGNEYVYSNVGYAVAGRVAEALAGKSWESLMQNRLFKPLSMKDSGFGSPGQPRRVDQPWPHRKDGTPLPDKGPRSDNAPSLGPAGRVHCTLSDYARFGAVHLGAATGGKPLLKPETLKFLHTPAPGEEYAGGWVVAEREWAGGSALHHTGSNNSNYFVAWLAPARGFGVMACSNQAGDAATAACDEVCQLFISRRQAR